MNKTIKSLKEDDRPREKLILKGSQALSDSELLAILIRNGSIGYSAIDIAKDMLIHYDGLNNLISYDFSDFKKFKGMGTVKAVTLAASFEIARRVNLAETKNLQKINSPKDIAKYFIPKFLGMKTEIFKVLLLSSSNHIFREIEISKGILNSSLVHPREVFKTAISESAAFIILLHNHPSGNPEPSKQDIHITKQLYEAGKIINIPVLDHIIIAGNNYISFKEMGLID